MSISDKINEAITANSQVSYSVKTDVESVGMRLDKFLNLKLENISRTRIKKLLEDGLLTEIKSGEVISDPARKVKEGESFLLSEPIAKDAEPKAQEIPLDIIFEDENLLVVNKPAGMVVHPANGHEQGTLVNALLHHAKDSLSGIGGVKRPGIVHRIDKDTSGLLVVAKNDKAHHGLSKLFHDHDIDRKYLALVKGRVQPPAGKVEGNIARHPHNRKKMALSKDRGKPAITHYKTLDVFNIGENGSISLIECKLETGRTHQVRVHMAHIGHPLLGDPVYGRKLAKIKNASPELQKSLDEFNRQALHAKLLGFIHPITGEKMHFESQLPDDMEFLIKMLKKG